MRRVGNGFPWMVGAMALFGLTNCGIYGGGGGGGGGPTANIEGNVVAVLPEDSDRDIVVFVYQLGETENEDCELPDPPDEDTRYKYDVMDNGATSFVVPNSRIGRLVVVFLLDEEGNDADGRIDPGDPIAVLDDPDCVLDDVPENYLVTIEDARINFSDDDQIGFPDPGRAEATIDEGPDDGND